MSGIKISLFDDNNSLRDSVAMLIADDEDLLLTGNFPDCKNLLEDIQTSIPDVVIMDIDMPEVNGIEAVKLIRKYFPTVQVLMQTVFDDDDKIFAAIKAGAGGYILKNAQSKNLLEAIREVYNGGAPMTPSIAKKVLGHLQKENEKNNSQDYHLSAREKEVLSFLVEGKSYKMIAAQLNISYDTVRAHMRKIYEKLHVSSMTEADAKAINQKLFNTLTY